MAHFYAGSMGESRRSHDVHDACRQRLRDILQDGKILLRLGIEYRSASSQDGRLPGGYLVVGAVENELSESRFSSEMCQELFAYENGLELAEPVDTCDLWKPPSDVKRDELVHDAVPPELS